MGSELTAAYRLIYFQPDPEDGERVCVALLFEAQGNVEVLYNPEFPKLRCLAPTTDSHLVQMYLDDLTQRMKRNQTNLETTVRRYTPQFILSDQRTVSWPLSNSARISLMKRFLNKDKPFVTHPKLEKAAQVTAHLKELVQRAGKRPWIDLREDVDSEWVLGTPVPEIEHVALGVKKPKEILLIDGVDLVLLKPKSALQRINRVTHTFWQYGRIRERTFSDRKVRRIGVVLNGKSEDESAPDYKDAHDFALHQFDKEAELVIDSSSASNFSAFEKLLHSL